MEYFQQALQCDVRELWERCLSAVYVLVESLVVHCSALWLYSGTLGWGDSCVWCPSSPWCLPEWAPLSFESLHCLLSYLGQPVSEYVLVHAFGFLDVRVSSRRAFLRHCVDFELPGRRCSFLIPFAGYDRLRGDALNDGLALLWRSIINIVS